MYADAPGSKQLVLHHDFLADNLMTAWQQKVLLPPGISRGCSSKNVYKPVGMQ